MDIVLEVAGNIVAVVADFKRQFGVYLSSFSFDRPNISRGFKAKESSLLFYALRCPWTPGIFRHGRRRKANFLYADYLALDFDSGVSIEQMENVFCDMTHAIMTTKSHTETHPRFRMIFPLERRCFNIRDYEHTLRTLGSDHDADPACFEGARFFWPGKKLISVQNGGYKIEILKAPQQKALPKFPEHYLGKRVIPPWARSELKIPHAEGHRFHACWRIAKDIMRSGFTREETLTILRKSSVAPGYTVEKFDHVLDRAVAALNVERTEHAEKGNSPCLPI
jgi:prepilin-type processing-associated H-X9-DG protein